MKLTEEMAKLIELGTQYGERVEYTRNILKVEHDYLPCLGSTAALVRVTISMNGSKRSFEFTPIRPCPGLQDLEAYSVALSKLTEFTDALRSMGYTYDGTYGQ